MNWENYTTTKKLGKLLFILFVLVNMGFLNAQVRTIPALVDFGQALQPWEGFGFNYVEACQHRDYAASPQDYGGFSLLNAQQKQEIIEAVFGEEGLQVEIVKMFLDPFHQMEAGGTFDHEWTTKYMREFVKGGIEITQQRGEELSIITTLYGPPAWATKQGFTGGRDLNPAQEENLCKYMADWVSYLKKENYPVDYLSIHNEGEDFYRWDFEEGTQRLEPFDYNMYWPPQQVNSFLRKLPGIMEAYGVGEVGITNGEPSNWTRFYHWGYARALADDEEALENLSLLTTHGFLNGNMKKLSYATAIPHTTDLLRQKKPNLSAWTTSFSWGEMGTDFLRMIHENVYGAKVNAIIPWAGIQHPPSWIGGDPNAGNAIKVNDDGTYEIRKGYHFYKQLTRAGKRGMKVAYTSLANPQAFIIAFSGKGTEHPDAFVLSSNIFIWGLPIEIQLKSSKYTTFRAYRSSEDGQEQYTYIGEYKMENGSITYDPPRGTTTTFIGVD